MPRVMCRIGVALLFFQVHRDVTASLGGMAYFYDQLLSLLGFHWRFLSRGFCAVGGKRQELLFLQVCRDITAPFRWIERFWCIVLFSHLITFWLDMSKWDETFSSHPSFNTRLICE